MRKFIVNVNGTSYEVEIEEANELKNGVQSKPAAPKTEAAPVQAAPVTAAPAGGEKVSAPMPGTILSVKISNGQTVKKGDVLFILEAMKLENEIMAPCDGVATVSVSNGATVNSGDLLCTIS